MSDWRAAVEAFPRERTWLLPALHAVQDELRWVPADALAEVASHVRVPLSEAYGIATGYPEFRLAEPGKQIVRVCTGVSCRIRGGDQLLKTLEAAADGAVTLEPFDCAFNCSVAPVVEVDGGHHGRVGAGDVYRLLEAPPHPTLFPSGGDGSILTRPSGERAGVRGGSYAEVLRHAESFARPGLALIIGLGSCSLAVGAVETLAALRTEVGRRGWNARIVTAGCNGLCWAAPVVTVVAPDGTSRLLPHATADRVPALLDAAAADRIEPNPGVDDFLGHQRRELTSRCGVVDPGDIADAIRRGSYATLADALSSRDPLALIETVKAAALRGRGGAYFAAALKWEGARAAAGGPKHLIVNAEEGEPGIFKDRHLMEGDPHRLLEGALLAALSRTPAAGGSSGTVSSAASFRRTWRSGEAPAASCWARRRRSWNRWRAGAPCLARSRPSRPKPVSSAGRPSSTMSKRSSPCRSSRPTGPHGGHPSAAVTAPSASASRGTWRGRAWSRSSSVPRFAT